jgi:hypothetical protein
MVARKLNQNKTKVNLEETTVKSEVHDSTLRFK